jgi:hypothetical protein
MASRDPVGIRLITRRGNDWTTRYPLVVEAVNHLKVRSCLIDGEVVCCDDRGLAVFQALRRRQNEAQAFLYASCWTPPSHMAGICLLRHASSFAAAQMVQTGSNAPSRWRAGFSFKWPLPIKGLRDHRSRLQEGPSDWRVELCGQAMPVAAAAFLAARLSFDPVFRSTLFADFLAFDKGPDFLRFFMHSSR